MTKQELSIILEKYLKPFIQKVIRDEIKTVINENVIKVINKTINETVDKSKIIKNQIKNESGSDTDLIKKLYHKIQVLEQKYDSLAKQKTNTIVNNSNKVVQQQTKSNNTVQNSPIKTNNPVINQVLAETLQQVKTEAKKREYADDEININEMLPDDRKHIVRVPDAVAKALTKDYSKQVKEMIDEKEVKPKKKIVNQQTKQILSEEEIQEKERMRNKISGIISSPINNNDSDDIMNGLINEDIETSEIPIIENNTDLPDTGIGEMFDEDEVSFQNMNFNKIIPK